MRNIRPPLLLVIAVSLFAQTSSFYRITHTYTLGREGGWNYLVPDPPNHLYSSRARIGSWLSMKTTGS